MIAHSFYYNKIRQKFILSKRFILIMVMVLVFSISFPLICSANGRRKIQGQEKPVDFTELDIEELKNVMIISILKKPQRLYDATSAITVITQDDIRKSGATSIPELLRYVPGFQVAQISSNTWAVSARGFNQRFANKLLVLMDGRSLYSPLFSGVHWGVQDTLFEDIERIEVIRGPGATLWGANAVNGVINIITKNSKDTQGGLVTINRFTDKQSFSSFRYGGKIHQDSYGRVYFKYTDESNDINMRDNNKNDKWDSLRGGFRIDSTLSERDSFTIQGDIYDGKDNEDLKRYEEFHYPGEEKRLKINNNFSGLNTLLRWERSISDTSDMKLQFYYDRTKQKITYSPYSTGYFFVNPNIIDTKTVKYTFEDNERYNEKFNIFDLEFQHNFDLGKRNEIVWGLEYRIIEDLFEAISPGGIPHLIDPDRYTTHITTAFLQDDIDIVSNKLRLTFGSKFEHYSYTGSDMQPSIRILWKPTQKQNIWTAISRSLRTPTRFETDSPSHVKGIKSEELIAYELGYRIEPANWLLLDMAGFYNKYNNLIPYSHKNIPGGETYGGEMCANMDIFKWWHLKAIYSYLKMHINIDDKSIIEDIIEEMNITTISNDDTVIIEKIKELRIEKIKELEDLTPQDQFTLISSMDIPGDFKISLQLRHIDNLSNYIGKYTEIDAHLSWNPRKNMEISVGGYNLFHKHHPEFIYLIFPPNSLYKLENLDAERRFYGKITCQF